MQTFREDISLSIFDDKKETVNKFGVVLYFLKEFYNLALS
jgi:hypothetical protein